MEFYMIDRWGNEYLRLLKRIQEKDDVNIWFGYDLRSMRLFVLFRWDMTVT